MERWPKSNSGGNQVQDLNPGFLNPNSNLPDRNTEIFFAIAKGGSAVPVLIFWFASCVTCTLL